MISGFDAADLGRFRTAIARRLGLQFDNGKLSVLADVLERRVNASGAPVNEYLARVENLGPTRDELRELARELTVGETYFFRHREQFRVFSELALPDRISARRGTWPIRLLSAGCASGEEAYSLAILARERNLDKSSVRIHAIDVNPAMIEKATRGRYAPWSLRETSSDTRLRWFLAQHREFILDEGIRGAVTFEERNMNHDDPTFWRQDSYDIVFCRNVLMYFTPENAERLVARLSKALVPGGFLFLGHAETLRGLSHDFHLRQSHETFYYQRKDGPEPPAPKHAHRTTSLEVSTAVPDHGWTTTWIETVQRAADRIKALSEQGASLPTPLAVGGPELQVKTDLGVALDLLKRERFAEALDLLGTFPRASARDPDLLLLRAVLLAHDGQLDGAKAACTELLLYDEFSAGAHYLLALCFEGTGDRKGAAEHDRTAAYLDPGFAMPRMHLGLMARRAGESDAAQRELSLALSLLEREDASRVLLFGGGFSRDGLMALCRAQLGALGGKP